MLLLAPAHLAADCQLVSDENIVISYTFCRIKDVRVVRRTYSNYVDRCSAAAGLNLWNSLPAELRQADLHPLLPERNDHGYALRRRRHERTLTSNDDKRNFIYRQLHKYSY